MATATSNPWKKPPEHPSTPHNSANTHITHAERRAFAAREKYTKNFPTLEKAHQRPPSPPIKRGQATKTSPTPNTTKKALRVFCHITYPTHQQGTGRVISPTPGSPLKITIGSFTQEKS